MDLEISYTTKSRRLTTKQKHMDKKEAGKGYVSNLGERHNIPTISIIYWNLTYNFNDIPYTSLLEPLSIMTWSDQVFAPIVTCCHACGHCGVWQAQFGDGGMVKGVQTDDSICVV